MMRGLFLVILFPFAALGSATPAHAQEGVAPQTDWMVHMDKSTGDWRYVPERIMVVPGGTVQLMVFGNGRFSLTLVDGTRDADIPTQEGAIRTAEFAAPQAEGEYPFFDKYHDTARGFLVVRQRAQAEAPLTIGVIPGGYESQFAPAQLRVAPGSEILFRANGSFGHNLQAVDESFSGGDLRAGEERAFTAPIAPGEYPFECRFHKELGMVGVLIVEEGAPGSPPAPSSRTQPSPSPPAARPDDLVVLIDNEIRPKLLNATAGRTITVRNDGATPHTYTAQDGSFDTGRIEPGMTTTLTLPDASGTLHVYCRYHASPDSRTEDAMAGDIMLRIAASPTPAVSSTRETPGAGLALVVCAPVAAAIALRRRAQG